MLDALLAAVALFALSRLYKFWSGLKTVGYTPGIRCALGARSNLGALFGTNLDSTLFYNPGSNFVWSVLRAGGFKGDTDIISVVPWLQGDPIVFVSSMEMMQQILGYADTWDKELAGIRLFGANVAMVQKEPWKRHRRVVSPAFSKKLYTLVYEESMRTFREMVDVEGWDKKQSVTIPVISDWTTKFTLSIIASCAFDFHSPWSDSNAKVGQGLPLGKCLKVAIEDAPVRLVVPEWAYFLPIKAIKRVDLAFSTLFSFMRTQVALRREKIASEDVTGDNTQGRNTIFNNIVRANVDGGKFAFDEDEVIANTFIMLFAGHETTSRALNAMLTLLALYDEEQDKVYQEIQRILPDGRDPTFEDLESFIQIRKCIQEAMRLYPSITMLAREAMHDTQLNVTNKATGDVTHSVVLKQGTRIVCNVVGIHHNPRHFPDPEAFKPSRWDDESIDADAFAGFGQGPRACIGRKFSLAEMTCFTAMLLRDWRVEVDRPEGESPQEWQRRVMTDTISGLRGLGPISVRLTKRKPM
ncbi:hypothetical protein BOTBODRAFT_191643 [Botryobasidium botryosum FD-172 SS1]|uniref:Cytochrome P450 n=1 Tax=Botryobasidium botryosum (strain FD-172 SS1) TaxID=930990 RepID=A0A067M1Q1_BOTB1|nr:hypothetical protein BOTBODRAFT_191643 [Botryobasidium botryosum FD-172 SS1]